MSNPFPPGYELYDQEAQRPTVPPSRGVIVAVTLFFGLFGLIPTILLSREATTKGFSARPYWAAFWWTFGVVTVVWAVFWSILIAAGAHESTVIQQNTDQYSVCVQNQMNNALAGRPTSVCPLELGGN
jgi:hypothetical protein